MTLEEIGIAPDQRDGTTLRASATARMGEDTSAATTTALISLVRQADGAHLQLDATTVSTLTKRIASTCPEGQLPRSTLLVIASATAYPKLKADA